MDVPRRHSSHDVFGVEEATGNAVLEHEAYMPVEFEHVPNSLALEHVHNRKSTLEGILMLINAESSSAPKRLHTHQMQNGSTVAPISIPASLPISSERHNKPNAVPRLFSSSPTKGYWDVGDEESPSLRPNNGTGDSSGEWSEDDLMEEDECRNVGSRRYHQGPRPEDDEGESKSLLPSWTQNPAPSSQLPIGMFSVSSFFSPKVLPLRIT